MKRYSTLFPSEELEPRHQMQFSLMHKKPHSRGVLLTSAYDKVRVFETPRQRDFT